MYCNSLDSKHCLSVFDFAATDILASNVHNVVPKAERVNCERITEPDLWENKFILESVSTNHNCAHNP